MADTSSITRARQWIQQADAVLISAGAGMSVCPDEWQQNVYINPEHFAKHYSFLIPYGYTTAYETMGLFYDTDVPNEVKWTFTAKHMHNMRWKFRPTEGHNWLREITKDKKSVFVATSNVDGCFVRSGFEENQIFPRQGDWEQYQCRTPCRRDSIFPSKPVVDRMLEDISNNSDGILTKEQLPRCPNCNGHTFGNVRAGGWFIESSKHEEGKKHFHEFILQNKSNKVVIVEIGAGFNTPGVLRFPNEEMTRVMEDCKLIRINKHPHHAAVPRELEAKGKAVGIAEGWEVLEKFLS